MKPLILLLLVTGLAAGQQNVPSTRKVNGFPLSSNVNLGKADIGLPNVDNTSDVNKPISTAAAAALAKVRPVFNVTKYGAVGNGVADDTNAFQNTVTAAKAARGTIYVPSGNYKVSGIALMLDWEGAEVFGEGASDSSFSSTITTTSLTRPVVMIPADYNNFKLRDFRVNGPTSTMPAPKTFTLNTTTDVYTSVAHGYQTGDMVMVSAATTLPAPLRKERLYYVIRSTADTFRLAYNYVRAQGGALNIDTTTAGSGALSIRSVNAGIVLTGDSLQSGGNGDGASTDGSIIDGVTTAGFNIGYYLEEFSNCSIRYSSGIYSYYGAIIIGNSASIISCPFAGVDVSGSAGLWMAGGLGSSVISGDFTGVGDIGFLQEGSASTVITGCNFETRGSRSVVSRATSGQPLILIGCYFGNYGVLGPDTYSLECGGETISVTGCSFGVTSTTTGSAIKQTTNFSRGMTIDSSGSVKVDTFSNGTFSSTYTAMTGFASFPSASGEGATINNWGHIYRRAFAGANDDLTVTVRNAAGAFALANLYKYHFDTAASGQPAWIGQNNFFTNNRQVVQNSANPSWAILTSGSDTGPDRALYGAVTSPNAHATGTATGDSVLVAKAAGSLDFATSASGGQIVRGKFKGSGVFHLIPATTPIYADNAAAVTGGLVSGDVYRTATGELRIVN